MDFSELTTARVTIAYANMAKMNRIRSWAKRNGCSVKVSRYAKDAYAGYVSFPMPKGRTEQQAMIAEFKAEFSSKPKANWEGLTVEQQMEDWVRKGNTTD